MKRKLLLFTATMLLTAGCSTGVSQEQYDQLDAQLSEAQSKQSEAEANYESLSSENSNLSSMHESMSSEYSDLISSHESMSSEYDAYKESMQSYEGLAEAEATARLIEAESLAAAEAAAAEAASIAAEEAKAAEEAAIAASIAAEEARGYETGITYDQLARTPDDFKGQKVKFRGKVVQVLESGNSVHIRMAVNNNYDTIVYATYSKDIVASRVLENDKITIYGISKGLKSYQSTMGSTITIPDISIDKIEQ